MEFLNFFRRNSEDVRLNPMSEQDIGLLALMCMRCQSVVVKEGLFQTVHYVYYVAYEEENIFVAQQIFKRNGINMVVHDSTISGYEQKVLRINSNDVPDKNTFKKDRQRIRQKYQDLYINGNKAQRQILETQLALMKQK